MHTVFLLFMLDFILLAAKHDAGTRCSNEKQDWTDPFDPYDDALWVDHLSPSHTLLLNKFNVVKHHVLVVTRKFEQQTDPLTLQDLEATWHVVQVTAFGMVFHCATIAYFCKSGPTFSVDPSRPSPKAPLHTSTVDQSLVQVNHTSMFRSAPASTVLEPCFCFNYMHKCVCRRCDGACRLYLCPWQMTLLSLPHLLHSSWKRHGKTRG